MARPTGYARWKSQESTYASWTMRWSGIFILLFIIYRVLNLSTGTLHPSNYTPFQDTSIFTNVIGDFRNWYIALIYVLAVSVLDLHLYHGIWSFFQTLGLNISTGRRILGATVCLPSPR
ncbi:MAG: succinate dehydrogenase/fumarate reductase transmembrane subunit [Dehalococcoidia bacterium]